MAGYEEDAPDFEAPKTFKQAFAEARAKGKGTKFTWKGKEIAAYKAGEEPESWKKGKAKSDDSEDDSGDETSGRGKGGGPQSGRVYMTPAMKQKKYYEENPEEGAKTGEITESLIGPKAKAAAGAAAAGAAGYGMKKVRDYLMSKAASARKTATDVAKGDLAQARSAAARSAEADAWAARVKNARSAPGMTGYKKGGSVKSSASSRADGIAQRGKTRGKIC